MGKTADEIANDISQSRDELESNLHELETRVKDAADWHTYLRRHPFWMVTAAMAGGMLLAVMTSRR
jgi:ElaB/YqjD/DUF883 family membrane-anchored ribosome-binding protein